MPKKSQVPFPAAWKSYGCSICNI